MRDHRAGILSAYKGDQEASPECEGNSGSETTTATGVGEERSKTAGTSITGKHPSVRVTEVRSTASVPSYDQNSWGTIVSKER